MNKVIYDGECPVCNTLKGFAEDRTDDRELTFVAFQEKEFSHNVHDLSEDEARKSLFVITENGEQFRGARAVFEIMSDLPGFLGGMGKILRLPPFYWIAEPFYRLFAKHRHGVSKFLQN
jgi:predicted DCC family thiol-disulfide oxidoreductase YuxK